MMILLIVIIMVVEIACALRAGIMNRTEQLQQSSLVKKTAMVSRTIYGLGTDHPMPPINDLAKSINNLQDYVISLIEYVYTLEHRIKELENGR
jgi:hypothetical protein